jgi:hypothetical protein
MDTQKILKIKSNPEQTAMLEASQHLTSHYTTESYLKKNTSTKTDI